MWDNFDLEELIISIKKNGYIPAEPLMVIKNNDESGYTVVEGNRRLSAIKLLTDENYRNDDFFKNKLTDYKILKDLKELPCYIFPKREDVNAALAIRHIKGVRTWQPREKAEYASKLFDDYGNIAEVNKIIGSKTNVIGSLVYAYKWLEYLVDNESETENFKPLSAFFETKFSFLVLALGQSNIKEKFLGLKSKWTEINYNVKEHGKESALYANIQLLCMWLSNSVLIKDSRQITGGVNSPISLSAVVGDEEARHYLIKTTEANNITSDTLEQSYYRIATDNNTRIAI